MGHLRLNLYRLASTLPPQDKALVIEAADTIALLDHHLAEKNTMEATVELSNDIQIPKANRYYQNHPDELLKYQQTIDEMAQTDTERRFRQCTHKTKGWFFSKQCEHYLDMYMWEPFKYPLHVYPNNPPPGGIDIINWCVVCMENIIAQIQREGGQLGGMNDST